MKIENIYYFGDHSHRARNEAIEAFKSDPELKVMVRFMIFSY